MQTQVVILVVLIVVLFFLLLAAIAVGVVGYILINRRLQGIVDILGDEAIPLNALAEALPKPGSAEAEELVDQQTGQLTGQKLREIAERAAFRRAGRAR